MSKLSKLIDKLGGVETGDWKAQFDRKDVVLNNISFDLKESISEKAVVIDATYTDGTGEHTIQVATRFQKDEHDEIELDGDIMENAFVDTDLMGELGGVRFQLECRFNNPEERTETLEDGENTKRIQLGNGNHEFRVMKRLGLGAASELGDLGKIFK